MLGETYCLAFCWYSRAFLVSAEALVVYSTALSTWASILMESCLKLVWLLWPQKVFVTSRGSFNLFTISPWFSTKTAMSMNISCNSLIDDSSFTNISCLEKYNDKFLPEETGLNFDHISLGLQELIFKRRFFGLAGGKWVLSRTKQKITLTVRCVLF